MNIANETPSAGAGGIFWLQAKTSLSPSGGRYIYRQESGVLCGLIKISL